MTNPSFPTISTHSLIRFFLMNLRIFIHDELHANIEFKVVRILAGIKGINWNFVGTEKNDINFKLSFDGVVTARYSSQS